MLIGKSTPWSSSGTDGACGMLLGTDVGDVISCPPKVAWTTSIRMLVSASYSREILMSLRVF